jgi:hypothetical protein
MTDHRIKLHSIDLVFNPDHEKFDFEFRLLYDTLSRIKLHEAEEIEA